MNTVPRYPLERNSSEHLSFYNTYPTPNLAFTQTLQYKWPYQPSYRKHRNPLRTPPQRPAVRPPTPTPQNIIDNFCPKGFGRHYVLSSRYLSSSSFGYLCF